jgi:hypothetical protein
MSKQSVSEIIDSWETHGLQNLHKINLDRIYAFPMARGDLHMQDSSVQSHLDHFGISRQKLVETKDEQVKDLMVELQLRELSDIAWKNILQTKIYWCDPEDREPVQSEFDNEVDTYYYSIKGKFEKISELLGKE